VRADVFIVFFSFLDVVLYVIAQLVHVEFSDLLIKAFHVISALVHLELTDRDQLFFLILLGEPVYSLLLLL